MTDFWHTLPKPIKVLAPMEDVTDTVFRRIVARCGRPDVFFTEFTNTDGMCSKGREAVIHRLQFTDEERPIVAQIWGNNPEHYFQTCRDLRFMGFDGIDINMGCPVKKIIKNGACSALIENEPLAGELIAAAKEGAGGLPVGVKTRLGFRRIETEHWTRFLLEQKPAVLTIHGRIAREMSDSPANWDEIGKAVRIRNETTSETLIIGNGDVGRLDEIREKSENYGVDGVMVGRGILHNIFLFDPSRTNPDVPAPDRIALLIDHLRLYRETWGNDKNFEIMKKFVKVYIAGFPGAAKLRNRLMETSDYAQIDELLADWSQAQSPSA